jgi:hypothetical protein
MGMSGSASFQRVRKYLRKHFWKRLEDVVPGRRGRTLARAPLLVLRASGLMGLDGDGSILADL